MKIAKFEINDIGIQSSLKKFNPSNVDDFVVGMGDTAFDAYSDAYGQLVEYIKENNISKSNIKEIRNALAHANDDLVVGMSAVISFINGQFDNIKADTAMVGPPIFEVESNGKNLNIIGEAKNFKEFFHVFKSFVKDLKNKIMLTELDLDIISNELNYIESKNKNNKYVVIINIAYSEDIGENKLFNKISLLCEKIESALKLEN